MKKKLLSLLVGIAGGLALTLGFAQPARADLVFCNRSNENVSISLASRFSSNSWKSEGWWNLNRGQCQTVWSGNLASHSSYWYYYAIGSQGTMWSGNHNFCTRWSKFVNYRAYKSCLFGNWTPFKQIYTGNAYHFTLNLTPGN